MKLWLCGSITENITKPNRKLVRLTAALYSFGYCVYVFDEPNILTSPPSSPHFPLLDLIPDGVHKYPICESRESVPAKPHEIRRHGFQVILFLRISK